MDEKTTVGNEFKRFVRFILQEMKPRGKMLTPFNIISIPIILLGAIILVIRFTQGLGAVTNLSQDFPWGFWIGFDVITGVAFAGGAYIITFVVYVMKVEKYHPIVRVTVLNGLLAYIFYAGALVLDLGKPWNIINPIIGNSFGYNSVLFLVAWHFLLYMMAEFIEFSPVVAEWLGWRRVRKFLNTLTLGAVIFGITLSSLHQSGLGALFLLAKSKIHPLWYTEFIPILFFVSSIFAGLSMIIVEGTISHRVFKNQLDPTHHVAFDEIIFGLAKGATISMFTYYFFKALIFIHERHWTHLNGFWGVWYLVEVIGLVLIPCFMFAYGVRNKSLGIIRTAAVLTLLGIILNRLNVSVIAFKWNAAVKYYPSWMEIIVTLMIIFSEIWVFRWIVTRMPVYKESRDFALVS
ncbi:MAG: polysulfide reductase NrfD [candidate division KSB1 bacterium]|nr:polysulfide reductase NrfD [candidate division KSB1 bacterium]MDZ7303017.1 polysulfide reductase NrfD [candidate division KSB1 bacterium]MDZ7312475.1 polysulfide reductase NrfD [candidate division KSB1 bacterium]